jgi:hypothetical protein
MAYVVDFVSSSEAFRRVLPYLRRDPLISVGPLRLLKIRNNVRMIVEVQASSGGIHVSVSQLDQHQT